MYQFVIVVMLIIKHAAMCYLRNTHTVFSIDIDTLSTIHYQIIIVLTDGSHRCSLNNCDILEIRTENTSTPLCGFHFLRISDATMDVKNT